MHTVPLPQAGGCVCGAVRYELNAAPLLVYACHCRDCQTRSGSAFALTAVIRTAALAIAGPVDVTRVATPSGRDLDHTFCPSCRARIVVRAVDAPDYASLRVGTLDDTAWVVPIAQLWVESAIPWAVIPGVQSIPAGNLDLVDLARQWRATAPAFEPS